jgi:hypothetical protein
MTVQAEMEALVDMFPGVLAPLIQLHNWWLEA